MTHDSETMKTEVALEEMTLRRTLAKLPISPVDIRKVVGGTAVLAGLLMHLVGMAATDAYLREWGIEGRLFPKSVDRLVIAGFGWLIVSGLTLWPVVLENFGELLLLSAAVVTAWLIMTGVSSRIDRAKAPQLIARLPTCIVRSVLIYLLVVSGAIVPVLRVFLASVVLAQPIIVSDRLGREQAKKDKAAFSKGCQSSERHRCSELRRGVESLGRGFLIESSSEHIAFFDVALAVVRVVPRQGLEVITPAASGA